jgi:hypothetical protein
MHNLSHLPACLQAVERPGVVPHVLVKRVSGSTAAVEPGGVLPGFCPAVSYLSAAADVSLRASLARLQVEHLNCEDAELLIIQGFMQQLGQQIMISFRDLDAAKQLLNALAGRTYDVQGHVHVWYWAGAIAQKQLDFLHALLFFRMAAACTLIRPHMSMSAKALTACTECILSSVAHACVPELIHDSFLDACHKLQRGDNKHALHVRLCIQMSLFLNQSVSAAGQGCPVAHDTVWPTHSRLATVKAMLNAALERAESAGDEGVELRALMCTVFVLKCDGVIWGRPDTVGGYAWQPSATVMWMPGEPLVWDVFGRWQALMRLRRNVMSLWRMLGVDLVLDPDSVSVQAVDEPVTLM